MLHKCTHVYSDFFYYSGEIGESEEILVNAPASFDRGRPGGHHGGGHHGGGHPGGHHGQQAHSWNCCLFAKAYCKLPCHGKLCEENYSLATI